MGWTTIYIQGKSGCTAEVLRHLEHSGIRFMPGSASGEKNVALFWIDEKLDVRDFKKAVGSRTIFKYRLRFFTSMEKASDLKDESDNLTPQDEALIKEMTDLEETYRQYKHSA